MKIDAAVNAALLILLPIAWVVPIARTSLLSWLPGSDVTILGGIAALWPSEPLLAALVVALAVVLPYAKTLGLAAIQLGLAPRGLLGVVALAGRLAMAEVFLVALAIILARGAGLGHVETAWGFWLFTACVLAAIWAGWRAEARA